MGLADELKACQANHGDSSDTIMKLETELKICKEDREKIKADAEQAAAAHTKAIADYERQLALATEQSAKYVAEIKALQEKLSQASVEAVKASEASASLSAASAKSALEATELILARAESLEASRKAESLDGFTPEPAK